MDTLLRDLRYGFRSLLKTPGFTAVAILTLALGIGANTAIFSVIDAVLLRPLPYRDAGRLVLIRENDRLRGTRFERASIPDFEDFRQQATRLESLSAFRTLNMTLTGSGDPQRLVVAAVSSDYFGLLGVEPALGRVPRPEESMPPGERVVVLGQALWRQRFGADRSVLGRPVTLDGSPYTVIGVMPEDARLPGEPEEAWTPLRAAEGQRYRGMHNVLVFGRLAAGETLESAQAEMSGIMRRLEEAYPDDNKGRGAIVTPLLEAYVTDSRPALLLLLAAVGLLLAAGCANVANLLLARAEARGRELAICAALGAGRLRMIRQLLTESFLLGLAGCGAGVVLAFWGVDALVAIGPQDVPRLGRSAVDVTALLFSLAVSFVAALAFGLAPAVRASRQDLQSMLKGATRDTAPGVSRSRTRRLLIAGEAAVTVTLVIGAALLARSFWNLSRVDPGYDPKGLIVLSLELPGMAYPQPPGWPVLSWPKVTAFQTRLLERVKGLPGVRAASIAMNGPAQAGWTTRVTVEGRPAPPPGEQDEAGYRPVDPDYFRTLGVPVVRGRALGPADREGAPSSALVNEAFIRRYFPDEDPIGRKIRIFGHAWEIVGVTADVRFAGPADGPAPAMHPSLLQAPMSQMSLVVRASGDPSALVPALRAAVWSVDKDLALHNVTDVEQALWGSLARQRFTMTLLALFAAAALLLAAVGIYGVTAHFVAARTHEIGVRMALGAGRAAVLRLVVAQGMAPVGLGLGAGLGGSALLSRFLSSLLFGVGRNDPSTFAVAALLLCAVAFLACYLPARRATNVDPMSALRCE